MNRNWIPFLALVVAPTVLVVAGFIAYKMIVWNECRMTNSWAFCYHIVWHMK